MKLKKQVIIITGGSSGIGSQIALDVAKHGANVCIIGRDKNKINDVIKKSITQNIIGFKCDITKEHEVEKTIEKIYKSFGRIDGLVNNAGINPSRNNAIKTSLKDWNETINTNLTGAFLCAKSTIPFMIKHKKGSIINISSVAGISALENRAAYMSSKWGLVGLSSSLAIDFSTKNIRINTICPGYVETPLVNKYISELSDINKKKLISSHLLGRLGTVQDISQCATFLLSNESSWITGAVIPVDGGFTVGKIK